MKKFPRLAFLLFSFLGLSGFSHIPQGATDDILNQALAGQTLIFNRRYTEAKAHFSQLAQQYPDSALGSFGLMALYNAQMFENFDFSLDSTFEEEQRRNKIIVDKIAKNENSSAWEDFLCGASSGLRGFYYVRKDAYLKAMGESGQARKCLDRALKKDPAFADVYLGLGLYDYWKSVFTSRIKFLPFFKDRRKEGIEEIQRAIQESIVAGDLAMAALTFVYHEQNNGAKGAPLAQTLIDKYPQNIMMRTLEGNFLSLIRKFPEAQATLDEVLKMDPQINVARYFKGLAYNRAGDKKMAAATFQDFLDHNPPKAWQAYAHYMLGVLALQEGNRQEAWKQFKAGENAYGDYAPNLKMILKMRRGDV